MRKVMKKSSVVLMLGLVLLTGCNNNSVSNNSHLNKSANNSLSEQPTALLEENSNKEFNKDGTSQSKQTETKTTAQKNSSSQVVEIKEKMFVAQTNDVYFNTDEYLGKTIKYEGIFSKYEDYYSVIRYGPGCCGVDANCGFEVIWDKTYPNVNDWVEVVGVLEEYEENGFKYLRLSVSSLKILTKRGAEYVSQ